MIRALSLLCALLLSLPVLAQLKLGGSTDNLLEPEKAFRFSARALEANAIEVRFDIADGYYLYRERLRFAAGGNPAIRLGAPELPRGDKHKDEFFGVTETYRKSLRVRIPVEGSGAFDLKVVSQGCADAGVCYVPMESRARLRLAGPAGRDSSRMNSISESASDMEVARLFEGNFVLVIASFLGFGLLLAFTPCVLPMIPILSGIIAGEGGKLSKVRALSLSLAYVLGMAVTYALAGVAAAYSGTLLAATLQNAWVLGAFALVFVVLALSMFGLFDLQLPAFVQGRLAGTSQQLRGGRIASVAAMGVLSAIIVSPCVAAPLAGALLYISQTRDVALGGAALFAMALGMGVPLVAVGVSEGALLPKSGPWLVRVKQIFGVLLLAVAAWIIWPVLAPSGAPAGFTRIASAAELEDKLRTAGRPAMLDFYADWCVSCKEMEKFTFSDPAVRAKLDRMLLLQADVTGSSDQDRALLKRFALFGPPGIIFFDAQGREIPGLRVIGYQNAERFLRTLSVVEGN